MGGYLGGIASWHRQGNVYKNEITVEEKENSNKWELEVSSTLEQEMAGLQGDTVGGAGLSDN